MRREYVLSFAAEGLTVALMLLAYRVAATQWTTSTFGEYALSRKIVSTVLVLALVGADVAIVRFTAFEAGGRGAAAAPYLGGALIVTVAASIALAALLIGLAGPLGTLLYGGPGHEELLPAVALVAFGAALHAIAYGHERGRLRMGHAGALLVVNAGVVPLLALLVAPGSVASVLTAMGLGMGIVGLGAILTQTEVIGARPRVLPVVRYGAPRAGGLLLQMAFLAAPGILAAHLFGIVEAGNVAFALLMLGLVSTLLTPIGVVLMPRTAGLLRDRATEALAGHIGQVLTIAVPAVVAIVLIVQLAAEPLVATLLGPSYSTAAPTLRAMMWAAIPWTFFVTLRGVIDAHDVRPWNALNVAVASAAYALLCAAAVAAGAPEPVYYLTFIAAVVVLAALTIVQARRALARPLLPEPVVEDLLQP